MKMNMKKLLFVVLIQITHYLDRFRTESGMTFYSAATHINFGTLFAFLIVTPLHAQTPEILLDSMTLKQKVGQLFMVEMRPEIEKEIKRLSRHFHVDVAADTSVEYEQFVHSLITKHSIGGVIFMSGTSEKQKKLTKAFQAASATPLLISMDAEWGAAMRLSDLKPFPLNMTLGALPMQDDELVCKVGHAIGKQLADLGVHINFAPVVDVNTNRNNPIINHRSFSQNADDVARKGCAYMTGLHMAGILACAKHYPGHGDVDRDSHAELLTLAAPKQELIATHLSPFSALIDTDVDAIMTAHIWLPSFDEQPLPATMSKNALHHLRTVQNFDGLIIADCMSMNGITNHYDAQSAALKALMAGVDILLMSPDTPGAIAHIVDTARKDTTVERRINDSVLKILCAKEKAGLLQPGKQKKLVAKEPNENLVEKVFEHAITHTGKQSIKQLITNSNDVQRIVINCSQTTLKDNCLSGDLVIVELTNMCQHPAQRFGISPELEKWLGQITEKTKTIVVVYGNPYSLSLLGKHDAVLVAYEDHEQAHAAVEKVLRGKIEPLGVLPFT